MLRARVPRVRRALQAAPPNISHFLSGKLTSAAGLIPPATAKPVVKRSMRGSRILTTGSSGLAAVFINPTYGFQSLVPITVNDINGDSHDRNESAVYYAAPSLENETMFPNPFTLTGQTTFTTDGYKGHARFLGGSITITQIGPNDKKGGSVYWLDGQRPLSQLVSRTDTGSANYGTWEIGGSQPPSVFGQLTNAPQTYCFAPPTYNFSEWESLKPRYSIEETQNIAPVATDFSTFQGHEAEKGWNVGVYLNTATPSSQLYVEVELEYETMLLEGDGGPVRPATHISAANPALRASASNFVAKHAQAIRQGMEPHVKRAAKTFSAKATKFVKNNGMALAGGAGMAATHGGGFISGIEDFFSGVGSEVVSAAETVGEGAAYALPMFV